jgi:tyrosyl-tRNA synthetase
MSAFAGDPRLVFCEQAAIFSRPITHLATAYELIPSKCKFRPLCAIFTSLTLGDYIAEAQRLVRAKGLYLNNKPVEFADSKLSPNDLIDGKVAILRVGTAKHLVLALA